MLDNQTIAQVLYEASNLLESMPWCKGQLARTKRGGFVTDTSDDHFRMLFGDDVEEICAEAAIYLTMGKFARPEARALLGRYYQARGHTLWSYNDDAKNKDEVLTEMRTFALELLEGEKGAAA